MTFNKFLGFGIISTLILGLIKAVATFANTDLLLVSFFILLIESIVAIACIRRLGVINYLESIMVILIWGIFMIIFDVIVLTLIFNLPILSSGLYWLGMLVILVSWFLFHQKRHVEIRRQNHKK
jgi:hypothetical protein